MLSIGINFLVKELWKRLNPDQWPLPVERLPSGSALVGGAVRDALLNRLKAQPDLDLIVPENSRDMISHPTSIWITYKQVAIMKNIFIGDLYVGILINECKRRPKTIKVRNRCEALIIIGSLVGNNSPLHSGHVPHEDPYPLATINAPYTISINIENKVIDNMVLCLICKFFQIELLSKSPNQIDVLKIDKNKIRISARAK